MSPARIVFVIALSVTIGNPARAMEVPSPEPASSQAIADYREGESLLKLSASKAELADIEQLFRRSAASGLPHAHYGLACVIYRRGDESRYKEAFEQARQAANEGVIEAEALLATYHWNGIGTPTSVQFAKRNFRAALDRLRPPFPIIDGAPGTKLIENEDEGRNLLMHVVSGTICGPPMPVGWVIQERGLPTPKVTPLSFPAARPIGPAKAGRAAQVVID